jgi:4Fe-4S ferredoxin
MVMKHLKTQTEDELLIERVMYTRRYSLSLDRKRCVGCEICQIVCPKEAIEIIKPDKIEVGKSRQPMLNVNENKCSFCGVCNAICPFGAFTLRIDGEKTVPVLVKETFPKILHEIEVDETKCPISKLV